ncbi:hypothetical protein [Nitrosococcus oceani]|uniref:hypothetical protein n=1 Tax=Nitrosococcus oceani TaxID=1229 RepID=UPI000ACF9DBA|nr:hypothetical protein [Nitrosococcus oceani]
MAAFSESIQFWMVFKNFLKIIRVDHQPTGYLDLSAGFVYNLLNTAATPLNNAQPWWLFYARHLEVLNA